MAESIQHKLDRVRPPRVQITYDVEIGDAIEMKELPFVAGILADLSGKPAEPLPKVKERKFVEIDRDNFNDVLAASTPRLALRAENKLGGEAEMLNAELIFASIEDFDPVNVVNQIKPLKKLFEARQRLVDLLAKLDGNDELEALLRDVAENPDNQKVIRDSTQNDDAGDGEGEE